MDESIRPQSELSHEEQLGVANRFLEDILKADAERAAASQPPADFDLMSFDLDPSEGGRQMIIAHRPINATEHYVMALGSGPKDTAAPQASEGAGQENGKVGGADGKTQDDDVKLRFFKLTWVKGKKYLIEEYVTPEGINEVAKFFA